MRVYYVTIMCSSWWLAISHRNFERELSLTLLFLFPLLLVVMLLPDAPKRILSKPKWRGTSSGLGGRAQPPLPSRNYGTD